MRAIVILVIIAVLVAIAVLASGLLRVHSTSAANVSAKAAQSPPFEVETGSVHVGTRATAPKARDANVTTSTGNKSVPASPKGR